MINDRRLHLLPTSADREARAREWAKPDYTPEQVAILALLDRVEALERRLEERLTDKAKTEEPTIEELCRPLSAKVMPRSAMHSVGGNLMDVTTAIKGQRHAISMRSIRVAAQKAMRR